MRVPAWLRGAFVLLATLVAGIVIGVTYERRHLPAAGTMMAAHHVMQMLTPELGLDSAQADTISRILAHHQGTVDSSWHMMQPQVRASLDVTTREILAVLRPDQAAKFRHMIETMHPR
jgi:hypothetical protein